METRKKAKQQKLVIYKYLPKSDIQVQGLDYPLLNPWVTICLFLRVHDEFFSELQDG